MTTRVLLADQAEARFYDVDSIGGPLRCVGAMSEETPKRHEALAFASRIAQSLDSARNAHAFDQLVVIASPHFMGMLRVAMPRPLSDMIVVEVLKDLMREKEDAIRRYLPPTVVRATNPPTVWRA